MNKEILILCPSRARPDNAKKVIESWNEFTDGLSDILFLVDDNDESKNLYPSEYTIIGEPGNIVQLINRYSKVYLDQYKLIGFIGDDHRFETKWEKEFLNFESPYIVYGDDGLQHERLCTAFFMTSNIIKALGYMAYPKLKHLYVDNFIMEIGRACSFLHYLNNVKITHYHPSANKSEWDETYNRGNNDNIWKHDESVFNTWYLDELQHDIEKIFKMELNEKKTKK